LARLPQNLYEIRLGIIKRSRRLVKRKGGGHASIAVEKTGTVNRFTSIELKTGRGESDSGLSLPLVL
jgi:hypothetical protein